MGGGRSGDEKGQARHDVEGDRRQFGVAMGQGLDQALGFGIDAKQGGEPGFPQVGVDKEGGNGHLRERERRLAAK